MPIKRMEAFFIMPKIGKQIRINDVDVVSISLNTLGQKPFFFQKFDFDESFPND